jgi:clathrin heavy chain
LNENKITCTDELGEFVSQNSNNQQLAQQIFKKSGNIGKIVETLVIEQNWPRLIEVAKSSNESKIDWDKITIMAINSNPQESLKLARALAGKEGSVSKPSKINIQNTAQYYVSKNLLSECTAFLISSLKEDSPEDTHMQTKLFELNLNIDIKQAEQIFQLNLFNNFDKNHIAKLCESKGLMHRALQHYTNIADIKRVILNTHMIPEDFIIQHVSKMENNDKLSVMKELAIHNPQMNNQIVARAAVT